MPSTSVTILMAVYNGEAYLPAQLKSFTAQTHDNWQLLASDDGSRDRSSEILQKFAESYPVTLLKGPRQGAGENFMNLLRQSKVFSSDPCWIAFADQDDVWLPDRLERGQQSLAELDPEQPALFCSRTWVTDVTLTSRSLSPARTRTAGFKNALVQNIAAGNTILLNPAASRLAQAAACEAGQVVMHDWWLYQIISGAGGTVIHDDQPTLLYRQHDANEVGANGGWRARLHRIRRLLQGDFSEWSDTNIAALRASAHRLTPANQATLESFAALRQEPLLSRLKEFRQLGLYRQTRASTLALWLALCLGRL